MATEKNKVILFSIIVGVGLLAFFVYMPLTAPDPRNEKAFNRRMEAEQQQLYRELGLTEGQKKMLQENRNKHREKARALFAQARDKMDLIRQELQEDELDMERIYRINNELKNLQAQMFDDRLEDILEVRKILTPEQFEEFDAKMKKRIGHPRDKGGRPGDGF